ncbi:DUF7436 family protein [Halorubrum ezzemoulense]|uniref:DUF7436 family protein n=1 Tax=Halorubrum ezzemoulense TaxID=337243 RepID=UPI003D7D5AE4
MLCPLSYAPSRAGIRGERLTLLTRIVVRGPRVSLPLERFARRVGGGATGGRAAVGSGSVGRVALAVDRARGVEQAADEQQSGAALDDDSLDPLFERIDAAEESIVVFATEVSAQFDVDRDGPALLDRLLAAIRGGVDVSVLISPSVFDDARAAVDEDRATLTIAQGPFELRVTEDAYGNFYLIDGEEVCLEVADPLSPDRLFGMLDLRDRGFAARVNEGFEAAWADGAVVDEV